MTASIKLVSSLLAAIVLGTLPCRAQCHEWDDRFSVPDMDGYIKAFVVFDDGSGPTLYMGGGFKTIESTTVSCVAKWNGSSWSDLDGGMPGLGASVQALAVFDDGSGPALFAAGSFTSAGGVNASSVAKWNGVSWSALGSGVNSTVEALAVYDDGFGPALFAGGWFTSAGGTNAARIARWNGTSWSALGSGVTGFPDHDDVVVHSMTVHDDGSGPALHVGGLFLKAGGVNAFSIAKWNGTSWSGLGAGMQGQLKNHVYALLSSTLDGKLYAGGFFLAAGGVVSNNIAAWNGSSWSALSSGTDKTVTTLIEHDDGSAPALYAGGVFMSAGGGSALKAHVARWNGTSWAAVGTGAAQQVYALAVFDDGSGSRLWAGGVLSGTGACSPEVWDGSSWAPQLATGPGLGGEAMAFTVFDDGFGPALVAGGTFESAAGLGAMRIAKWNGSSWSSLGSGAFGYVAPGIRSLATYDDGSGTALFAGGQFTSIGGVAANHIAKWNGSSWSSLGTGISGAGLVVYALTAFDDGSGPSLFAGGTFVLAGDAPANGIARWNGSSWVELDTGLNGFALALKGFDDGSGSALFVAGNFTTAGGVTVKNIAKWNGATWSPVGAGIGTSSGQMATLASWDDGSGAALYVGGSFSTIDGVPAANIAKWNGTSWSALASGVNSQVRSLAVWDDGAGPALYVSGDFLLAGGASASRIAKWNGTTWSALGAGTNGFVGELMVFDDGADGAADLYAGGSFSLAGGIPSQGVAEWHGCEPGAPYCFGDGLDAVVTAQCPCANYGDPGRGCANSIFASGARLHATGTTNPNTVVFLMSDVPNNALATGFSNVSSMNPDGVVFGDGVRCQSGALVRFGSHNTGSLGDAPNTWSASAFPIAPGLTRYYQVQYRNPNAAFCPPGTFNISNGYQVSW